jgi:KDO2-lipid IV(A) lauroyltransferase
MSIAFVYQLGARLLPYVPSSIGYSLCDRLSYLAPLTPAWSRILFNVRHVLPRASEHEHQEVGRQIAAGLLKNYFDLLRAPTITAAERARGVTVEGLGNLEQALARGKGAIVAMPHMGNLSLVAEPVSTLARTRITTVIEQMRDPAIHGLLKKLRSRSSVELVEVGPHVTREVGRALREGGIVVLASDRTVASATVEVEFFGATAVVPSGPALMALRSGAPLLTAYTYRPTSRRSIVVIDPPLLIERRNALAADVRHVMQGIIRIFEAYIRRHPSQWLLTEPVWKSL